MKKILFFLSALISLSVFAQEKPFTVEEITVNPIITGNLYTPNNLSGKTNLVILIAGSGMPDRNGNQIGAKNNSLKFLAEGLAEKEIAVFSFDKRTIALLKRGDFNESKLSLEDFISDIIDISSYFRAKNQYANIIIAGHSEGSLIGMIAAKKNADAFISLAGPGRPIDVVIEEQIGKQAPRLKEETRKYLDLLKKGETFELKNPMLGALFRESLQPYLISWIKYNPQEEIKALNIPVQIIGGTKDIQVPVEDAQLLKEAFPKSELVIIENMNHVFKEIKEDSENIKSYSNPDLPVMPELIDAMALFIKKI